MDITANVHTALDAYRDQSLQEVLEIVFGVLKADYLNFCGQLLQSSNSWQESEAALFGIRYVPSPVLAASTA